MRNVSTDVLLRKCQTEVKEWANGRVTASVDAFLTSHTRHVPKEKRERKRGIMQEKDKENRKNFNNGGDKRG